MTILFLPGFMTDGTLWDHLVDKLDTAEPFAFADLSTGCSIQDMAQAVLDEAPASFTLVGFSMGGYVARELVRLAPDRVRALVLIATSARPDSPDQAQRKVDALRQLSTTGFSGLSRAAVQASLHVGRSQDHDLIERVRGMSVRLGRDTFARQAAVRREGDLDALSCIACPTLVVAADEDRLRSIEESRELAERIPDAQLAVIKQSGHMIPLEAPEDLARVVSAWLKKTLAA